MQVETTVRYHLILIKMSRERKGKKKKEGRKRGKEGRRE